MLIIDDKVASSVWHVGEYMPHVEGRVVTFHADGDELDVFIDALEKASRKKASEKELLAILKKLPLKFFDKDPSEIDAAIFSDHATEFVEVMDMAREVLKRV